MKKSSQDVTHVFITLLNEIGVLEKQSKKYFQQIRKAAFSPELAKAIHEEQTGINDHIKRLDLIRIEFGRKNKLSNIPIRQELPPLNVYGRRKCRTKDLYLICNGQQVLQSKIIYYKLLLRLALSLNLEHTITLVKQTIFENEATITWLDNVAQRSIAGESSILDVPA